MQSHYEEMLEAKDQSLVQLKADNAQVTDKLQFEIDYLRKEIAEQLKRNEVAKHTHNSFGEF